VSEELASAPGGPAARVVVADMGDALARITGAFSTTPEGAQGTDAAARIAPGVALGPGSWVGPFAVLETGVRLGARSRVEAGCWIGPGVVIGDDCHLGPHAVCYPGTWLGDRVVLKAGAVIGGPGFGFVRSPSGHRRVPHLGGCRLEDDVEVGSASCIDRGSFDDTVIGRGTKIDNLVQVGHNVHIGEQCLIMATTGIAGSVRIGSEVVIAGGVGISDHAVVGDRAVASAKSVIIGAVEPGSVVGGYPARPHRAFLRAQAALYRLAPLAGELAAVAQEQRANASADHRAAR
jgi:UDP-3-O-[3-hydroxymyristoyl] glucosamine N-acyltransferase